MTQLDKDRSVRKICFPMMQRPKLGLPIMNTTEGILADVIGKISDVALLRNGPFYEVTVEIYEDIYLQIDFNKVVEDVFWEVDEFGCKKRKEENFDLDKDRRDLEERVKALVDSFSSLGEWENWDGFLSSVGDVENVVEWVGEQKAIIRLENKPTVIMCPSGCDLIHETGNKMDLSSKILIWEDIEDDQAIRYLKGEGIEEYGRFWERETIHVWEGVGKRYSIVKGKYNNAYYDETENWHSGYIAFKEDPLYGKEGALLDHVPVVDGITYKMEEDGEFVFGIHTLNVKEAEGKGLEWIKEQCEKAGRAVVLSAKFEYDEEDDPEKKRTMKKEFVSLCKEEY